MMQNLSMKGSGRIWIWGCLWAVALSLPLQAQVLMLDFGPTTVVGASQTNSMYHTVNTEFTDTSWNRIGTADTSSLLWSDGESAAGLSLNLGATTTFDSTTIGLGNTPSGSNALGNATNTGVYADTSVGKDGIFTGGSGNTRYVGFQLGGLAAGIYEIYVTSRNTNTSSAHNQHLFVGSSSASGDFNAANLDYSASLSYASGSDAIAAWVEGANYLKFTVTLEEGDYLNMAVVGTGGELRGFLNAVQIVTIPEPSTHALIGLGLGALSLGLLRRGREPAIKKAHC